ncbi:FliM/FliN family flagellar motor switch protein [Roseibaca sp. Y0-43]|uniref:FliM/FliN family flagellar motor switch protein n=1 Tax=Roseibaca sp. Y0-43 TaxID=2816854 RepID=UPI001D0C4724|nr:FliM/FliN family flagellar motor C-terminal domain-containing protein [Roseibaca sp. Y0-43]MCC1481233.1 FliM/FliN family flagellar motor switch protein [Roseibaca sp. Y0-43]
MEQAKVQQGEDGTDPLLRMTRRNRAKAAQQGAAFQAALSQAFGRMCAGYPGLTGAVTHVARRRVSLAELVDLTEPGMFLALLEGPGDAMGMAWLCPATLAALIEAQTTGQVTPGAAASAPPRLPTRTDAALLAPMIDSFLHQISQRCAELPEAEAVSGFVYGSFLDDRRPVGVVMDDVDYDLFSLDLDLAQGRVSGTWTLALPRPAPTQDTPAPMAEAEEWQTRMAGAVENSPVTLNAVLCRFKLTLKEALDLSVGDVLRVPDSALETLGLTTISAAQIATGRLGQARGFRAVRLIADPTPHQPPGAATLPTLRLSKAAPAPTSAPIPERAATYAHADDDPAHDLPER